MTLEAIEKKLTLLSGGERFGIDEFVIASDRQRPDETIDEALQRLFPGRQDDSRIAEMHRDGLERIARRALEEADSGTTH